MGYTDVFGGELIFPSRISYLALTTAVDITLQWPTEQQITGGNVVADVMDVTTTVPSLNVDMPDARNTSEGNKTTINNVGGQSFTVRDNTGGTIQSVAPGEQWVLVLTSNLTIAGTWTTFQLGANVAVASASALAGAGIKAIGVLLNQQIDSDEEAATPITVVEGDRAKCLIYVAGAGQADLPGAGTVGNDWFFMLRNSGSGTLAVVPSSGTIDGSSSINLDPNDSAFIFTDGINWFTIGLSTGSTIAFDFVSLPIPGSGDFVLSGANLNRISYRFTGALTGNRKVVVPNTTQQYWCDNQTTGAFVLTIGTAAQAVPPVLNPNTTSIVYCDSTDVIDAVSQVSVMFPITVAEGGTGATTAPGAIANLGAAADTIDLIAGDGMLGGGDLSGPDRTFDFDLASIATAVPDLAADFFVFEDVDNANVNRKALLSTLGLTIDGTPADNEIAVFTGPSAIEGDSNFRWTGTAFQIEGTGIFEIRVGSVTTFDLNGMAELNIRGMDENDTGLVLEDGMRLTFEDLAFANPIFMRNEGIGGSSGTISVRKGGGVLGSFELREGITLSMRDGADTLVATFGTLTGPPSTLNLSGSFDGFRIQLGSLYIFEQAVASASSAQSGQIWIESLVANTLMFTDDSGIDFRVSCVQWFNNYGGQQTINNSTVFVNITQLSGFQLDAGNVYHIEIFLKCSQANVTPDIKIRLNRQNLGTFSSEYFEITSVSSTGIFTFQDNNVHTVLGAVQNAIANHTLRITGTVDVGTGDVWDLQFAQNTATVANTIVDDESWVRITKIGPGP